MSGVDGHTGRDALVGGFAGHEHGEGHTGRDAAVGGFLGHEHKKHEEKKMEKQEMKANQEMAAGGGGGKETMGDKIGGAFDKLTGKSGN